MTDLNDRRAALEAEINQLLLDWPAPPEPPSRLRKFLRGLVNAFRAHPSSKLPTRSGCPECRRKDILIKLMNHDD